MTIKPVDIIIILISLSIILFFLLETIKQGNDSTFAKIEVEGQEYLYPLNKDNTYKFTGTIGETTIEVKDGHVAFIDSPCTNKTCIQIGEIDNTGETSACLPNRVLITVEGTESSEVDVATY